MDEITPSPLTAHWQSQKDYWQELTDRPEPYGGLVLGCKDYVSEAERWLAHTRKLDALRTELADGIAANKATGGEICQAMAQIQSACLRALDKLMQETPE